MNKTVYTSHSKHNYYAKQIISAFVSRQDCVPLNPFMNWGYFLDYYSRTNDDGTLGVYEKATDKEVPNNANPSKRKILLAALEDLGGDMSGSNTLYQLQHKLEKIIRK